MGLGLRRERWRGGKRGHAIFWEPYCGVDRRSFEDSGILAVVICIFLAFGE